MRNIRTGSTASVTGTAVLTTGWHCNSHSHSRTASVTATAVRSYRFSHGIDSRPGQGAESVWNTRLLQTPNHTLLSFHCHTAAASSANNYIHAHAYTHTHPSMCACAHTHAMLHVCTCTLIHIHTHTHSTLCSIVPLANPSALLPDALTQLEWPHGVVWHCLHARCQSATPNYSQ